MREKKGKGVQMHLSGAAQGIFPGSGHSCLGGLHMVDTIPVKVSSPSCAVTGVLVEGTSGDF